LRLVVYSDEDLAGRNIASHLLRHIHFSDSNVGSLPALNHGDIYLLQVKGSLVNFTLPPGGEKAEWVLCLSKHRSESGRRCLTAHTPGNLRGSADLGGRPNEVAISNPSLQSHLIKELSRSGTELGIDCQVSVEATHHGPTELPCPVTFVEIGSDEEAWKDETMGEALARGVARVISSPIVTGEGTLGVGGGHYSEKFTSLIIDKNFLIGHMVPKYVMNEELDDSIFRMCIERTFGGCASIVIDWKGTPSDYKESLRTLSQSLGIEFIRV
jgi:D-aminoacyl-tRNA deacylase